jgi:hypothetical protein
MTKTHKLFPWDRLEKGDGFFVPALDTDEMTKAGLEAAVGMRVLDARAFPGLYNGCIGVCFYRFKSRKASPHPTRHESDPTA